MRSAVIVLSLSTQLFWSRSIVAAARYQRFTTVCEASFVSWPLSCSRIVFRYTSSCFLWSFYMLMPVPTRKILFLVFCRFICLSKRFVTRRAIAVNISVIPCSFKLFSPMCVSRNSLLSFRCNRVRADRQRQRSPIRRTTRYCSRTSPGPSTFVLRFKRHPIYNRIFWILSSVYTDCRVLLDLNVEHSN